MAVREWRRRKRGSYRCKHRNDVSRWLLNVIENLERARRIKARERMYDSVEDCMKHERLKPRAKGTP
jgi:hypothetical protein